MPIFFLRVFGLGVACQHELHHIYYMSKLLNTSENINTINSRHMLSPNPNIILI
jgi:hypothetical protein